MPLVLFYLSWFKSYSHFLILTIFLFLSLFFPCYPKALRKFHAGNQGARVYVFGEIFFLMSYFCCFLSKLDILKTSSKEKFTENFKNDLKNYPTFILLKLNEF